MSIIPVPVPATLREIAVLRLIGRLGLVVSHDLARLLFCDVGDRAMREAMVKLVERNLVWRKEGAREVVESTKTPGRRVAKHGPYLYGLTHEGRALLGDMGVEPADGTLDRFISRDRRAPAPSASSMLVDRAVSAWCASVLDHARRTPLLVGVNMQARYAITAADGSVVQTIGALVTLAFDPKAPQRKRHIWELPWLSGEAISQDWKWVRLALEVEVGTASSLALMELANAYKVLAQTGADTRLFGGKLRPVILVLQGQRAGKMATAWYDTWPGSPAVLAKAETVIHPEHGALWGTYVALKESPVQPATLLAGLVSSVEHWAKLVASWQPSEKSSGEAAQ